MISHKRFNGGFTLIELLVVISIISMLASVVIASVSDARERGRIAAGILFDNHNYGAFGIDQVVRMEFDKDTNTNNLETNGMFQGVTISSAQTYGDLVMETPLPQGGKSLQLIDSNKSMIVNLSNPIQLKNFTLSAWIKRRSQPGDQGSIIVGGWNSNNTSNLFDDQRILKIGYESDGEIYMGSELSHSSTNYFLPLDKWVHVAFSYNSSTCVRSLYIDGKFAYSHNLQAEGKCSEQNYFDSYFDYITSGGWENKNFQVDNISVFPYSIEQP